MFVLGCGNLEDCSSDWNQSQYGQPCLESDFVSGSRNSASPTVRSLRAKSKSMKVTLGYVECEVSEDEGAGGKTVVFGLIKRKGKMYTQVIKNCSLEELVPIIRKRVGTDSRPMTVS